MNSPAPPPEWKGLAERFAGADLAFSLGPNCRAAWNVRSYFGLDKAYPFDWWITPSQSMLAMLDPAFVFYVEPERLRIVTLGKGVNTVFNDRLSILHHHDFPRDATGMVRSIEPEKVKSLNDKYRFLFRRLHQDIAAANQPVAILNDKFTGWDSVPGVEGRTSWPIEPGDLVAAIRQILGPKLSVLLVSIGPERYEEYDGGARVQLPAPAGRDATAAAREEEAPDWARPVSVFRAAFAAVGLTERPAPQP